MHHLNYRTKATLFISMFFCLALSTPARAAGAGCFSSADRPFVTNSPSSVPAVFQIHNPAFKVFAFGAQLTASESNFPLFPATDLSTFQWENLLTPVDPAMKRNVAVWANRCIRPGSINPNDLTCNGGGNDKGNPWDYNYLSGNATGKEGKRVWAYFSTSAKSNACTALSTAYAIGKSHVKSSILSQLIAGLNIITIGPTTTWTSLRDQTSAITWVDSLNPKILNRWNKAKNTLGNVDYPEQLDRQVYDTCIVRDDELYPQNMQLSRVTNGITIDYEVADLRKENETTQLFQMIRMIRDSFSSNIGRNLSITLYTNPLNRSAIASGISALNGKALLALVDNITIHEDHMREHPTMDTVVPMSVRDNLAEQLKIISGNRVNQLTTEEREKILVMYEMKRFAEDHYTTRLEAARQARAFTVRNNLGGIMLWRNGMNFNQSCDSDEWKAFACVTLGYCE